MKRALALLLLLLVLPACTARWTRLDGGAGPATYCVRVQWGTEGLP